MTLLTVQRKLLRLVIGICSTVVIICMTSGTRIGCIVVITVMTHCTVVGNRRVRTDQLIEIIVYREGSRRPARISRVACFTGGRQIQGRVIRIHALVVVCRMAPGTGVGRIVIVTLVAIVAVGARVRAREWPETVIKG